LKKKDKINPRLKLPHTGELAKLVFFFVYLWEAFAPVAVKKNFKKTAAIPDCVSFIF
jgi:hypothetical protein